jgi:hypothetical protein
VRSSFQDIPQAYGYYEQGVTNSYDDEIFSVSSGFHNTSMMILYLRAADITRLYINREAGIRNIMVQDRLNGTLPYIEQNYRYAYFAIPIRNPEFAQAVPEMAAEGGVDYVQSKKVGCREIYKTVYCDSHLEEFVGKDTKEIEYLTAYVNMLENPYYATAKFTRINPDNYRIDVFNATADTAVVIKMTYDKAWLATVGDKRLDLEIIGPDFMVVRPKQSGDYTINMKYRINKEYLIGAVMTVTTFLGLCVYFFFKPKKNFNFPDGDMDAHK